MVKRGSRKIRSMDAAAIAAKQDDQLRIAVNDVGAAIGLPEAQRGHHAVKMVPTAVDGGTRPLAKTLRKLTNVERLVRSKAIDDRQAEAINLYVSAAEVAYGSCVRASSLGEGGGSSPTGAAAAAHSRQLDRAYDADRYQVARAALPAALVGPFERVVLDNHPLGVVGAQEWPQASKGAVSGAIRQIIAQCADALCLAFERELGRREDLRGQLLQTMRRFDGSVRAETKTVSDRPISDMLTHALLEAGTDSEILLAPETLIDLQREAELNEVPSEWCGVTIRVVDRWRYGWLLQRATGGANASG